MSSAWPAVLRVTDVYGSSIFQDVSRLLYLFNLYLRIAELHASGYTLGACL